MENTIFKTFINQKDYDGGITRSELKLDDSITDIWKLSSNENILGPSPKAMNAITENISNLHEYGFRDDTLLKEAICKATPEFTPKTIFTANGGSEILELITRAFLEPGLECIISTPTFIAYKNLIESEGAITVDVPLEPINYTLDVEAILDAINDKTRIIFVTNPNNPTGTYTNKTQIDYLINSIPNHVVVVYDEVYYHFSDAEDFSRAIDYIKQGKNVIGVHSFSKSYGLAGIRLGYGISTEKITNYIDFTGHNSITTNKDNYWDSSHLRVEVTKPLMARVFNDQAHAPKDFGVLVTKENIETHLKNLRNQIESFDLNKTLKEY